MASLTSLWRYHGITLGILVLWTLATGLGLVSPIILPSPAAVVKVLPAMMDDGFLKDLGATVARFSVSLLVAMLVGIPLGLLLGSRRRYFDAVERPIHGLRSVPATALFPLLLIVVGVGEMSTIALAAYPSALILLVNSAGGALLANRRRVHQATLLGLTRTQTVMDLLFFEALPHIFASLRVAVSYSLALVIAIEMFVGVGSAGLGRKIFEYQSTYQIPKTYAAIVIAGLLGIGINKLLSIIERRYLRWMPATSLETG